MKIKKILSLFDLREPEINTYRQLLFHGPLPASGIAEATNLSRPATYDHLKKLIEQGLVYETMHSGIKTFAILPPEKIELLLEEKQAAIEQGKKELALFQKEYQENKPLRKPSLVLFENKKEIQQMMKDLLLYRDITVRIFWPGDKLISILDHDFLTTYHEERINRNIEVKVLWPENDQPDIKKFPFLASNENQLREARLAPPEMDLLFGYAVYKDTVRFISLTNEHYGFLTHSHELAALMKAQFDVIWKNSKQSK